MRDSDFSGPADHFLKGWEERELDRRVSEEKTRFEALCKDVQDRMYDLRSAPLFSCEGPMVVEKSSREKCLEALADGCTNSKQVCERLHPEMGLCSKEDKRRLMKATSMLLLRLVDRNLAWACKIGRTCTYYITVDGGKRLRHSREERERIAKAEELRVRREAIAGLNEQMVENTKRMRENTGEALRSLGDDQGKVPQVHSAYGGLVESLSRVIVMLQRALNAKDDSQRTEALDMSTQVLKTVGDFEASLSGGLILVREELKPLKEEIRRRGLEKKELDKRQRERHEKQEKELKKRELFDALVAKGFFRQLQKSQQPRTIDEETKSSTTQPTEVWTVRKKPPEPKAQAVRKEDEKTSP